MFDLEKQIADWRAEMSRAGIRNPEVLDELEAHLREQMNRLGPEQQDTASFQAAVRQLGDSQTLKQEFAKVNRFRFWFPHDNPVMLNVLGAWLIISGIHSLDVVCHKMIVVSPAGQIVVPPAGVFRVSYHALFTLVGIGLVCRRNFWRYCAFGLLFLRSYFLIVKMYRMLVTLLDTPLPPWWNIARDDLFLGLSIPSRFIGWIDLINLGITVWGALYLVKPTVRDLFLSRSNNQTAEPAD